MLGDISLFYEAANGRFYTSATGNGAVKGNGGMRGLLGFHLRCHSASLIYCKSSSYIKEKKRGQFVHIGLATWQNEEASGLFKCEKDVRVLDVLVLCCLAGFPPYTSLSTDTCQHKE